MWQADPGRHCADYPTELFFPAGKIGSQERLDWEDEAKWVCTGCPVLSQCLAHAIRNGEEGIWGGTTKHERKELSKCPE